MPICDVSWTHDDYRFHVNPLNIGQIVNNRPSEAKANVCYEELNLHYMGNEDIVALLPNVPYGGLNVTSGCLRLVPLIATKDINCGDELYSSYFSVVES